MTVNVCYRMVPRIYFIRQFTRPSSRVGAVHKLRHAEGGRASANVTMHTLSIHQYGIMCDEGGREGGGSKIA